MHKSDEAPKSELKNKKRKHNKQKNSFFYKEIIFPAILTFIIIGCLMFLIVLMTVSHTLGPMDRQFIAQVSGMFGVAFTSCCVYWLKDKKNRNPHDE